MQDTNYNKEYGVLMKIAILFFLCIFFSIFSYADNAVFFTARTYKTVSYTDTANSVPYNQTMEIKTSDIYSLLIDDTTSVIAGPILIVSSKFHDIEPYSTLIGATNGKLLFSRESFKPYKSSPYSLTPAKLYELNYTIETTSLSTSETVLVSQADSYLSKEVSLYSFYSPCISPDGNNVMAVGVKQTNNDYQLWNFSLNGESISKEIFTMSGSSNIFEDPINSIDLKNISDSDSLIVFDNGNGKLFEAFTNSKEVKEISFIFAYKASLYHPRLSSDSKKIAFIRNQRELVVADFDFTTSEIKPGTDNVISTLPLRDFDISPDGSKLLVSIYYKSSFRLGIINISDKALTILNTNGLEPENVNWQ